jgi:hypothetical protein
MLVASVPHFDAEWQMHREVMKVGVAGQSEMLLPISGKKGKEAIAEPVAKSSVRRKRSG